MLWQYPLIMTAAISAGVLVGRRTQRGLSVTRRQKLGLALGAVCGAMIAAKLPFVFSDWDAFLSGRAWFDSGKTIMLGLVGGYLGVELAKWVLEIREKTGDSFAVPVAVSIGLGRLGCFAAGCCYGTPTMLPWGVDFGDGLLRHPTQLYETVFHLTCAVILAALQRDRLFSGQLIKLYFMAYFVYRFLTEFIRPEPRLWLGLTGYQWGAAACLPLFAILWWHDSRPVDVPVSAHPGVE